MPLPAPFSERGSFHSETNNPGRALLEPLPDRIVDRFELSGERILTADVVGGGLCSFKADENVQKLLARTTSQSQSDGNADEPKKPKPQFVKSIGDLSVIFESLKGLQSYSASVHQVMVNLIFTNSSSAKTIAVALYADRSGYLSSSLVGAARHRRKLELGYE